MPKRRGIREKRYTAGDWMEVDIIPAMFDQDPPPRRRKKYQMSSPAQRNLNDKKSRRYLSLLVVENFTPKDLCLHLTYATENLPPTVEDAERQAVNYIRRVNYHRNKAKLSPAKYILVTEFKEKRVHHHILISGGLCRDKMEALWGRRKKKDDPDQLCFGENGNIRIGYANADRLQFDDNGIVGLTRYITKEQVGKKRWSSSHNLTKPKLAVNDSKYGPRQIEKLAKVSPDSEEFKRYWERQYPGYVYLEAPDGKVAVYNDITGWSLYIKMRKRHRSKDRNDT